MDSWFNSVHLGTLLSVMTLQTLGVISPGPDFAVVTRNSILYSRKVGVATALGIAAGVMFHVSYLVLGFGLIVSSVVKALFLIKIAGCLYLSYLGWKSLKSSASWNEKFVETSSTAPLSVRSAFWSGFLTNVLNPKAILFLLSLFTLVIDKNTPSSILIICGAMIVMITVVWFLIVSLTFSGILRNSFLKMGCWIDRITGGFLLFVGIRIGLSSLE